VGPEISVGSRTGDRLAAIALAFTLLPLVVSAVALVVKVGGDYAAGSDIG